MAKYNHKRVESKWRKKWLAEKVYEPDLKNAKNPFYNLMMFPYPSAEGLHVGNVYAFVGSDIYGRFKRMQGYNVFEPIGLDGFGIHSENYALKIGEHPMDQARVSEKNFYRQLQMIGNGFAWHEKLETYDPEYYKWTQWIFIQLYKNGLAYRKKSAVNWCPSCLTVLADEQVISGECERCNTKVIKKELEQWFFRITKYADKLLKGLDKIDWSEKVKIAQKNWIGKSEGASIKFPLTRINAEINADQRGIFLRKSASDQRESAYLEVFTTRPDTVFGVTFIAISPEKAKSWLDIGWQAPNEVREYIKNNITPTPHEGRGPEKTGVFSGISAINPANNEKVPVWISDYVLAGYGTGAVMGVPAHDERDLEFAQKFKLPVSSAPLVSIEEGIKKSGGKKTIQFRLRDWLISRQRYWGAPIPLVFCENCAEKIKSQKSNLKNKGEFNLGELENPGWVVVPEKDLPVRLPYIKNFRPTGTSQSPLAADEKFYKVKCPKCEGMARRETDVSDTFLDSAWYYLRYASVKEKKYAWDQSVTKKWCPVDMYIGGAEHSVLHLLYVRFLAMVFKDLRLTNFDEPFKKFRAHGLLIKDGAKMSKSKGNVVNPDEYIKNYGADVLRMYLMFLGPFDQGGDFRDGGIKGIIRFLERIWKISNSQFLISKQITLLRSFRASEGQANSNIQTKIHKTIKKVTEDLENLNYNTSVSALMVLLNEFEANIESVGKSELEIFAKILAPFAPHMSEEIFREILKNKKSIHIAPWPKFDVKLVKDKEVDIVVQVNARMRAVIKMPADSSQKEVETAAKNNKNISKYLVSPVKKVIFIKDRFINFVV
ncbi:MAG: class I tRNA ligase family protein [bacterium]|nr:class I tRNA ligase family protein [bacterium]